MIHLLEPRFPIQTETAYFRGDSLRRAKTRGERDDIYLWGIDLVLIWALGWLYKAFGA